MIQPPRQEPTARERVRRKGYVGIAETEVNCFVTSNSDTALRIYGPVGCTIRCEGRQFALEQAF